MASKTNISSKYTEVQRVDPGLRKIGTATTDLFFGGGGILSINELVVNPGSVTVYIYKQY